MSADPPNHRLVIDLSNTIGSARASGLQRVATHLAPALVVAGDTALLDGRSGTLRHANAAARWRLSRVRRGDSASLGLLGTIEQRVAAIVTPGRKWTPRVGDVFFDMEPSWHSPIDRTTLLPGLVNGGARTAALIPDVLPLTNPAWFPPASVERFARWFEAHVEAGSQLFAISESTADAVLKHLGGEPRPSVVPLGSSSPVAVPPVEGQRGILAVGTIEPRKGYDTLVDALDSLGAKAPTVDVVGQAGWAAAEVINRLAAHPKIRWHQHLNDHDLDDLWGLTGLLVQPTLGEGFGLPVLDALARGIPVLASDLEVLRETSAGDATFFEAGNADQLAHHLDTFANDPDAWPAPNPITDRPWSDGADVVWSAVRASQQ